MVITLEHEKEEVKMYNQIKQRVLDRIRIEEQEEVRVWLKVLFIIDWLKKHFTTDGSVERWKAME